VDVPPSSGFSAVRYPLGDADPSWWWFFYPHDAPSSISSHGEYVACSGERRLKIYPHDMWIHPQPVVVVTG
jgi:hypothetical protein